jgi:hypothetical protein
MEFNTTFNSISAISRWSVLLVEETLMWSTNVASLHEYLGQYQVIIFYLCLFLLILPMQSVPVTTKVVRSNSAHCTTLHDENIFIADVHFCTLLRRYLIHNLWLKVLIM